jgi:IS605 OrfB family transposase
LNKSEVSLSTLTGRQKFPIIISKYHQEYLKNWKIGSADLIVRKNNQVFLNVTFTKDIADTEQNGKFVGLDRGIKNIAVTSDNKFYTGKHVKRVSQKYKTLRSKLQQKGTKSAKRHLRKLSGKEKRFKADVNHCISKSIINNLNKGDTLVLEDLTGIRAKRLRKTVRTLIHGWSFYQLEQFLKYKAQAEGITLVHKNACYTSQKCSCCGYTARTNRKTQGFFECKKCGFKLNADLNASRNIRNLGLNSYQEFNRGEVNHPNVSEAQAQSA